MPGGVESGSISVGVNLGPSISIGKLGGFEGGLRGAVSVSGPSIKFGGPSFEAAPIEPAFGSTNEGPVRGSLEGFKSMNISDITTRNKLQNVVSLRDITIPDKGGVVAPLGEIVFNQSPLTAESVISQAEAIIAEARIASNLVVPPAESLSANQVVAEAKHWLGISGPRRVIHPSIETPRAVSPSVARQTEPLYAPQEKVVEQIIKEAEIKAEDKIEEPAEVKEEEEIEETRIKYVEDEPVSRQRRYELKEAIKRASEEAKEEGIDAIEGWRIKQYFVPEHGGNRSGIAQPGTPDGSLVETYQEISDKNYESEGEANETAETIVTDKKPVKRAQEGRVVKEIDIARVRRDTFLKRHPVEEVVARVVKKKILAEKLGQRVVVHEAKQETGEPSLKEIEPDLAEVFGVDRLS